MDEPKDKEGLKAEIGRGNFVRAALLATSLGLPDDEVQGLRQEAMWQMSAVYRNGPGTKSLAQQYGFSREEAGQILEKMAKEKKNGGQERCLAPRYDHDTGKYLSFEEWMGRVLKNWDKLSSS
jgi:hypothetical protein